MLSFPKIALLSSLLLAGLGMPVNAQTPKSFQELTTDKSKIFSTSNSCTSTSTTSSSCTSTSTSVDPPSNNSRSTISPSNNSASSYSPSTNSNSTDSDSTDSTSLERAVFTQINQYRASRGLPPLSLDSRISSRARSHSQDMASGTVPFSHAGFDQRVQAISEEIPEKAAAENVAYNQGYNDPATQAVQGWLRSDGHRRNIEGQFNLTGIGIAKNANDQYYFTQIFVNAP